jgi:hypothetical protein
MSQRTIATGMLSAVVVIVGSTMGLTNSPAVPTYPSLQASPDLTLTGSVAFVRGGSKPCVYVMAASGATTPKKLFCDANIDHGPTGLSWSDGHVFVHSWTEKSGSQLIELDSRTGRVVGRQPANDEGKGMPAGMQRADGAIVEVQGDNGRPRVVIRETSGATRTIFDPRGPRDYWLADVAWSPDGNSVVIGDSENRILIVDAESAAHAARLLTTDAMWPAWTES